MFCSNYCALVDYFPIYCTFKSGVFNYCSMRSGMLSTGRERIKASKRLVVISLSEVVEPSGRTQTPKNEASLQVAVLRLSFFTGVMLCCGRKLHLQR